MGNKYFASNKKTQNFHKNIFKYNKSTIKTKLFLGHLNSSNILFSSFWTIKTQLNESFLNFMDVKVLALPQIKTIMVITNNKKFYLVKWISKLYFITQ